jgi:hypothetical protein
MSEARSLLDYQQEAAHAARPVRRSTYQIQRQTKDGGRWVWDSTYFSEWEARRALRRLREVNPHMRFRLEGEG